MSAVSEYTKWWDGDGTLAPSEVALGLRLAAAAIAELEAELRIAYENADFDEPLTFKEYRADLQEQASARAKYEAETAALKAQR